MQAIIDKEGGNFKLKPWDWWYYAEKIKKEKYDFDEEELRPYFKLENVLQGSFDVANKLFSHTGKGSVVPGAVKTGGLKNNVSWKYVTGIRSQLLSLILTAIVVFY